MAEEVPNINVYFANSLRSNHRRCSVVLSVLKSFTKFTRKHLYQSLFFNNIADIRPATLLKKKLRHRCFPVNFVKLLWSPFLQNTCGRLLLFSFQVSGIYFWYVLRRLSDLFISPAANLNSAFVNSFVA